MTKVFLSVWCGPIRPPYCLVTEVAPDGIPANMRGAAILSRASELYDFKHALKDVNPEVVPVYYMGTKEPLPDAAHGTLMGARDTPAILSAGGGAGVQAVYIRAVIPSAPSSSAASGKCLHSYSPRDSRGRSLGLHRAFRSLSVRLQALLERRARWPLLRLSPPLVSLHIFYSPRDSRCRFAWSSSCFPFACRFFP
jgi:hypothetical protein